MAVSSAGGKCSLPLRLNLLPILHLCSANQLFNRVYLDLRCSLSARELAAEVWESPSLEVKEATCHSGLVASRTVRRFKI